MTEPRSSLPTAPPEGAPAPRTAVPAAPPERRTTEIDKQRVPMAAKPYRLLALVKQDAVVRVQKEPDDTRGIREMLRKIIRFLFRKLQKRGFSARDSQHF